MNNKFASRKFSLAVGTQLLLFICLWTGTLPADNFQVLTMALISGYLISNVSQRVLTKEKNNES